MGTNFYTSMGALETLANNIKQNPEQTDTLLDNYLSEFAVAPTLQNLQMIIGQVDRARRIVATMHQDIRRDDLPILNQANESLSSAAVSLNFLNERVSTYLNANTTS